MASCVVFHSYKGGTGKTTISANFAALLAKKGYRVSLLDLDVYAPSLQAYFGTEPKKWINDFLFGNADVDDIMMDVTNLVQRFDNGDDKTNNSKAHHGKLWIGLCNAKKEEIYKLESGGGKQDNSKINLLRKFILLREQLLSSYNTDYIVIDTSPGIRYWSINSLAVADTLFLTLKMGDLDIDGTRKMAEEIYSSFTKFGAKSYLILNKVAGYCVPHTSDTMRSIDTIGSSVSRQNNKSNILFEQQDEYDVVTMLSDKTRMEVISAIPCYCDIQFSRKEFLTSLQHPEHPFAKQISSLIESANRMKTTVK